MAAETARPVDHVCPRCGGDGTQRSYDEHEAERGVFDTCYHCGGTGRVDTQTYLHDRVESLALVIAQNQISAFRKAVNEDPDGDGWSLRAAENGLSDWDYYRCLVDDRAITVAAEIEKLPRERVDTLLRWNENPSRTFLISDGAEAWTEEAPSAEDATRMVAEAGPEGDEEFHDTFYWVIKAQERCPLCEETAHKSDCLLRSTDLQEYTRIVRCDPPEPTCDTDHWDDNVHDWRTVDHVAPLPNLDDHELCIRCGVSRRAQDDATDPESGLAHVQILSYSTDLRRHVIDAQDNALTTGVRDGARLALDADLGTLEQDLVDKAEYDGLFADAGLIAGLEAVYLDGVREGASQAFHIRKR